MENIEHIWYVIFIHPNINARYARLKIRDHIRQSKMNIKEQRSHQRRLSKVYIKSLRLL